MNKKQYIWFLSGITMLLMLVTSCENEISFNKGGVQPKLTMNAFIYVDSLTNRLYLSLTGETLIQTVGNTTVEVTVNGELKETLTAIRLEGSRLRFVDITTRFRPGDVVRIDARTDDGEHHAWIQETVPIPVPIEQIDTSQVVVPPKPYYYSSKSLRFRIRFKDRPNERNYYRLVLEQRHIVKGKREDVEVISIEYRDYQYWPWEDIALTNGRPATSEELDNELFERETNLYGVFTDSWFKDSEYTLNVQIPVERRFYYNGDGFIPQFLDIDVAVCLLSITETEYYYLTTMNIIDSDVLEDYISDPVKIPSNVHGGGGIVGISSESSQIFRVIEGEELEYEYLEEDYN